MAGEHDCGPWNGLRGLSNDKAGIPRIQGVIMSQNGKSKAKFQARTISIPADLWPWAKCQAASPAHAGNLSSYVRNLILKDYTAHQPAPHGP